MVRTASHRQDHGFYRKNCGAVVAQQSCLPKVMAADLMLIGVSPSLCVQSLERTNNQCV